MGMYSKGGTWIYLGTDNLTKAKFLITRLFEKRIQDPDYDLVIGKIINKNIFKICRRGVLARPRKWEVLE